MNAEQYVKEKYPFVTELFLFVPYKEEYEVVCNCKINEPMEVHYKIQHPEYDISEVERYIKEAVNIFEGRRVNPRFLRK